LHIALLLLAFSGLRWAEKLIDRFIDERIMRNAAASAAFDLID